MSNIEQLQDCEARIFCFFASRLLPLASVLLVLGFTKVRKRELKHWIEVSSVRFLLTLLSDFHKDGTPGSVSLLNLDL